MAEHHFALIEDSYPTFLAGDLLVKPADQAWERRHYYALRREVFCEEQQLLAQDRDEKDFQAIPIVAIAHHCGMPEQVVGAVRIYQSEPGVWYGGRLCVDSLYRRHALIGQALVNEAVSRAIELGCQQFLATVQQANERYFQRLHWDTLDTLNLHGQPHCLMQAQLARYPLQARQTALLRPAGKPA